MTERTLNANEREYKNMMAVAKMLEALSPNEAIYEMKDVYLDLGADWMWTTICRRGFRDCQILCPRDWKAICMADTAAELAEIVDRIRADKYFADK